MILVVNNKDSFVYNLARYFEQLGERQLVRDSHSIELSEIQALAPKAIVISPGPCSPRDAGISVAAVKHFAGKIPILGVCLGHQAIAEAFGWRTTEANSPSHGRQSQIRHTEQNLFKDIPSPVTVGLYHSLIAQPPQDPTPLHIDAISSSGDVMAIRHEALKIFGVQFHPESILTDYGYKLLENFIAVINDNATT